MKQRLTVTSLATNSSTGPLSAASIHPVDSTTCTFFGFPAAFVGLIQIFISGGPAQPLTDLGAPPQVLSRVALKAKAAVDRRVSAAVVVFDDNTSDVIEVDSRGTPKEVLGRLDEFRRLRRAGAAGAFSASIVPDWVSQAASSR
jgi:hypothetical protein